MNSGIRWGSLRTKIIAWFFIPTAIILVVVALVTFYAYQQVTEELVIERDRELTRLSAGQLAAELTTYIDLLESISHTASIYHNDLSAQRDVLKGASNRLTVFDAGTLLLDTFGNVVAVEPERSEILDQDMSDRPYYHEMLRAHLQDLARPVFSDILPDGPEGADVVAIAVSVTGEQNEFFGAIVGMFHTGEIPVSAFYGSIVKLRLEGSGIIYLVDSNGRVIYHSDTRLIGDNFSDHAVLTQLESESVDARRLQDFQGQDIVASIASVPETPWKLVIEESWETLTAGSRRYQNFLLLLLVLGVVAPALVVATGIRRVMRPIEELIGAAKEVAKGNFGHSISARTGDEIEELSKQFNIMSFQLKESYATLEQRVADRTMELETLNAIAAVMSRSLDLNEILNDALDKTLDALEIEAGGIYLLREETENLILEAYKGFGSELADEIDNLKVGEGFSGQVVQTGEPLVVSDIFSDPRLTRMAAKKEGFRTVASFPLVSRGKVLGAFFAGTREVRGFSQQDIDLITSIGQQIGVAIENAHLFKAVQRRAEQFKVISELGRRVTSILAVDELLNQMVVLIQEAFNYYLVEIGLVDGDEVVYRAGVGGPWAKNFESFRLKVDRKTITGWVVTEGEPIMVPDVRQEPRYVRIKDTLTLSELVVPIKSKDRVIGVLNVESDRAEAFDESDMAVLRALGDQAAIAIENAGLFTAEQRRAEQFRVISEVGRHITSILDTDELLLENVRLLKKTFGYYLITIGLIEGDDLVFKSGVKTHWDDPHFRPPSVKVGGKGITAWVAATGEAILAPDVSKEPRYLFLADAAETRSELAVPLKTKTGVIGVLNVESDKLNAFDESDLAMLQSLADQTTIAIENARLYEQARELAVVEERNRLARDLHDAVTQTLFSASLIAEVLPRLSERDPEEGWRRLEELRQLTRGALAEMRTLLIELRPAALADAELGDLLHQLAEATAGRGQVVAEVKVEGYQSLPDDVKVVLYRIAQEAMNNVAKHAGASEVSVRLSYSQENVELSIKDNGRGFDPGKVSPEHLGLGIMRERVETIGATLKVDSEIGSGTEVIVVWPNGQSGSAGR